MKRVWYCSSGNYSRSRVHVCFAFCSCIAEAIKTWWFSLSLCTKKACTRREPV